MARKSSASAEYEHHVVGVRQRVTGSGSLKLSLESYQAVKTQNLLNLTMASTTSIEPTRLANFQSQRIRLVGKITGTGDWFDIKRIIIYGKPVAVEYPMVS